ncbi:MAG: type II toxin-antitoxin system VapC family toxin [Opitutales bacterium]
MKTAVVDTSVSASWILPDEQSELAEALLKEVIAGKLGLLQPVLWQYEMVNLIRSAHQRGRLTKAGAKAACSLWAKVFVHDLDSPDAFARQRTLELAMHYGLSGYDAAYLELAQRFVVPLYSADARLQRAAKALGLPQG